MEVEILSEKDPDTIQMCLSDRKILALCFVRLPGHGTRLPHLTHKPITEASLPLPEKKP